MKYLILLFSFLLLIGCSLDKDKWLPVVYPNEEYKVEFKTLNFQQTLDDCIITANNYIRDNELEYADFICGKDCDFEVGNQVGSFFICKEQVSYRD
tara:strand:+ start:120 stop:407 length:288 start_codon:yes stop_codon:yes gene_type:complete